MDDTLSALAEAKRARDQIFNEHANLTARMEAEGTSAGLEERLGTLNRAIANYDKILRLEAEHGRESIGFTKYDPRHRPPDGQRRDG